MALQKFPGFIDIHVHLRDPGATHKEDFLTGSRAALCGGFTFVCDMPNNYNTPTISIDRLLEKIQLAKSKSRIDIGFHFGTDGKNLNEFPEAYQNPAVFGLKVYCGVTTGNLVISDHAILDRIFASWNTEKPILVHATGELLQYSIELARVYKRRLHVCHVSTIDDVESVQRAKSQSQPVTCGVTPHHLFLREEHLQKLGKYGLVKPPIENRDTQNALWESLTAGLIDIVESDHAPHTREEKESNTDYFGVPGLETTAGLLFLARKQGRLTTDKILHLLYEQPKRIFSIPEQKETFIELDPDMPYTVGTEGYQTKCGWSPFDGWELYGKVEKVILYGKSIY